MQMLSSSHACVLWEHAHPLQKFLGIPAFTSSFFFVKNDCLFPYVTLLCPAIQFRLFHGGKSYNLNIMGWYCSILFYYACMLQVNYRIEKVQATLSFYSYFESFSLREFYKQASWPVYTQTQIVSPFCVLQCTSGLANGEYRTEMVLQQCHQADTWVKAQFQERKLENWLPAVMLFHPIYSNTSVIVNSSWMLKILYQWC